MGGSGDGVIGWIREIVLNAPDPLGLASFWAGLLGGTPVQWYPGWVTLEPPPHGQRLSFQGTGDGAGRAAGLHFDILVSDLDAAERRVIAAGGSLADERVSPRPGPGGEAVRWRVCRDPAGSPLLPRNPVILRSSTPGPRQGSRAHQVRRSQALGERLARWKPRTRNSVLPVCG